jgi:hypothetical protein
MSAASGDYRPSRLQLVGSTGTSRVRRRGGPLQPPGGGGGDNEARLRVLETHVDYTKGHLACIETATNSAKDGMSKLKAETGKLSVKVNHLPSKGVIVSVTISARLAS